MPNKRLTIGFCVLLLFSVLFLSVNTFTLRAQTLSLGLYPPLLEVMIQPGKSIIAVFKLYNFGDPAIFTSKILPFSPADELGNIAFKDQELPSFFYRGTKVYSLCEKTDSCPLFNFENANLELGDPFFLKNGQNQEAVLKLKIPEDTPEGDYYATLFFSSTSPPIGFGSSTQTLGKIGANILITVSQSGIPKKKAEIVEFSTHPPFFCPKIFQSLCPPIFDSFDKIALRLRVKNTGTAFFKPIGQIAVSSLFHKKDYSLLPQNVLKGHTRLLVASPSAVIRLDQQSSLGSLTSLTLFGFHLGRYKAKAEFTLDEKGPKIFDQVTFWALPIKLILGLILVFFVLSLMSKKAGHKGQTGSDGVRRDETRLDKIRRD